MSVARAAAVAVALAALTLVVFAPLGHAEFISLDDPSYVAANPHVAQLVWSNVVWAFTQVHADYWIPLTWISYMVDVQLHGLDAGWLHLTNVGLHAANVVLLFAALAWMTGSLWKSAVTAALFAVHPLHVESVAWIAERKDVLSTLFWWGALVAYVWYTRSPRWPRYALVCGLCAASLLAKPMAVMLPVTLLLLDVWPLGRWRWSMPGSGWRGVVPLIVEKIPLFALAVADGVVTLVTQQHAESTLDVLPLGARVGNAVVSYGAYLIDLLWPVRLTVFYPFSAAPGVGALAAASVALAALTALAVRVGSRAPYVLVGWLWYLLTLLPVIGLTQVGLQAKADRFTYVPLVGIFVMLAWGIPAVLERAAGARVGLVAGSLLGIGACAAASVRQVSYWQDSLVLWTRGVEATPGSCLAHLSLGTTLDERGRANESLGHYQAAARLCPNLAQAHNNLGLALLNRGDSAAALPELTEAVRLNPRLPEAQNNLGNALATGGRLDEAADRFREAIRLRPGFAEAHNNLGNIWLSEHRAAQAADEYSAALALEPAFVEAHNNLASALGALGRLDEAIAQTREAIRLQPRFADAHENLGLLLSRAGQWADAMAPLMEALRLNPRNPRWHYQLAVALMAQQRFSDAVIELQTALALDPGFAEASRLLTEARALAGR